MNLVYDLIWVQDNLRVNYINLDEVSFDIIFPSSKFHVSHSHLYVLICMSSIHTANNLARCIKIIAASRYVKGYEKLIHCEWDKFQFLVRKEKSKTINTCPTSKIGYTITCVYKDDHTKTCGTKVLI